MTRVNVTAGQPEVPSDTSGASLTSAVALAVTFPAVNTGPPPLPAVAPPPVDAPTAGFVAMRDPDPDF